MVKLGDEVRDRVTGFKGMVIGVCHFLNGCTRIGVQPKCGKDGKIPESVWIDEPQLVVTKPKTAPAMPKESRRTGGPVPSVPQRQQGPRL